MDLCCYLLNKLNFLKCFCNWTKISLTLSPVSWLEKRLCTTLEETFLHLTVAWFPYLGWTICGCFLGLFREEVHPSFIHVPLDEPRMTIQAIILFHKITNLTELSFFSDHMVIVKIHAIICRSESQRISVALESKWLITYNQIIFPQLCTTWFLVTYTFKSSWMKVPPEDNRDT